MLERTNEVSSIMTNLDFDTILLKVDPTWNRNLLIYSTLYKSKVTMREG